MVKRLGNTKQMNGVLLSFLLAAAGAFVIFLPFLVVDKGFFLYCGDYNSQQIPFYAYVQQFIKTGGGTWSWATDLGSSVVNSYSFYNIGSPFLWLTLPFPQRWLPYLMVPLFMLKFGAIAAGCCLWLKRYAKTRNMAVICSVIYALCGFNVYNTFFNHMLDPVAIFPLLLWALDGAMLDGKRGWFGLLVGVALLNSYFFFIGNVVFLLIYFVVKVACGDYTLTAKRFFSLAAESVLGVGIGMALALPSYFNLIQNPRTNDFAEGWGLIMYGKVQQYFAIISSLFLPPDPPYDPNLYTDAVIKWTSMSAFLPVVSVAGVAAYWKARRRTSAKWILGICLVMALVPVLNSSFYAFNRSYYARWYYMPLIIMVFATLQALEDADIDLLFGAKVALVGTGAFAIFGLLPARTEEGWKLGLAVEPPRFWLTYLTALFGVVLFYVLVRYYRKSVRFGPLLLSAVLGFSVFYSVTHISMGKFKQWDRDKDFYAEQYVGGAQLDLPSDSFYRIDAYNMHDNFGLWVDKSCLQTFNSVVTPSIMEFYPMVGVKRDVSSKPETKFYALRGLLGVRYTVVPHDEQRAFEADYTGSRGWNLWANRGPFAVYENQNFIPLGFTYDSCIHMDTLWGTIEDDRSALLVRAVGLDSEQMGQYRHLFEQEISYGYTPVSYESYEQDAAARRATAAYAFEADASGFRANIDMAKENLVFFAVPYDNGFAATVNGQPAEILKVSGGMMAVYAPAGDNEIVFRYKTPGFGAGLAISAVSLLLLAAYVFVGRRMDKRVSVRKGAGLTGAGDALPIPRGSVYSAPADTETPPETGGAPTSGAEEAEAPPGTGGSA